MSWNKLRIGAFMVDPENCAMHRKSKSFLCGFYPAEIETEMAGAFSNQIMFIITVYVYNFIY